MARGEAMRILTDTVVRFRIYIYGTKPDLKNPDCQIKLKADLWVTTFRSSEPEMVHLQYWPRAEVDLDKMVAHEANTQNIINISNWTNFKEIALQELAEL